MEYDNDDNIWRRPSSPKAPRRGCERIPRRSTSVAVIVLGLAVLSCLLGYCVLSETLPYESKTLRLVIIYFRHGARTPVKSYNSDPYKNYQWNEGWGGLTNAGKMQLYELGKKYRSYYGSFIPEDFYEKDIYIRSSDKSRCMMSAYTFLAGLYPPTERQMWNPEIPWQPIPVRSLPYHLDNVVAARKPCKKWKRMYDEVVKEQSKDPKYSKLMEYLTEHTNESVDTITKIDYLYSTLMTEQEGGLKLPEWTKNVFPHMMRQPFMDSLASLSYNKTFQRLHTGPLLREMKRAFEDAVHSRSGPALHLYSGHDVNVVSLWRALGLREPLEPEYGASLLLELHEERDTEPFSVKVFYRNNTKVEVPLELKLPFCEEPCAYSQFASYLDELLPDDWEAECENN